MASVKNEIHVCFISRRFYPITAGGSERWRRFLTLLHNQENNIRASVITIQHDSSSAEEILHGLPIRRYQLENNSLVELIKHITRQYQVSNNWPNVIILESGFSLLARASLSELGRHSTLMFASTMSLPKKLKLPTYLLRRLESVFINQLFDVVLCGSQFMSKDLQRIGIRQDLIQILLHGVDIDRFYPFVSDDERLSKRRELGFEDNEKILLFVGHLTERKGVHILIEAFHKIADQYPNTTLNLIGGRWDHDAKSREFADNVEDQVKNSSLSSRIRMIDAVSNIEDYFRIADIFVFPSAREGMPNALLEAMASGLPCILTPFTGFSEELGMSGQTHHLVERNSDAIAKGLVKLIDNPLVQTSLGQAACQLIRTTSTLQNSIVDLEKIIIDTVYRD